MQVNKLFCIFYIICIVSLCLCIFIIWNIQQKQINTKMFNEKYLMNTNLYNYNKKSCIQETVYCFTNNDCTQKCDNLNTYNCVNGICKSSSIIIVDDKNQCDNRKGVLAYLVGNTAFGTYEFICKSIDPGIAININENKMCAGDPLYSYDYTLQFPQITDCMCEHQSLIPATSQVRKYVECDDYFYDLVALGQ
uniref:PIF-3 n=1 Tax=Faxonius propinquus nudivirus TaxID=3139431 RepID=A0AAU8GFC4_9VIRU